MEVNSAFPPTWSKWVWEFSTCTGNGVSSATTRPIRPMPSPVSKSSAPRVPRMR
jgi:hypothetical protein